MPDKIHQMQVHNFKHKQLQNNFYETEEILAKAAARNQNLHAYTSESYSSNFNDHELF